MPGRGRAGPRAALAARNNAEWCDKVCRTHGAATAFHTDAWISTTRSPPMFPDAVTLTGTVGADHLLARIDRSPGCSVKDSFTSLDLSGHGFEVLFEADWVHRPSAAPVPTSQVRWRLVRAADELQEWASGHGGGAVFRPGLVDDPAVAVLRATDPDGCLVAGAVGNRSRNVVGLSNLFTVSLDIDQAWAGAVAAVSAWSPGLPIVGYEQGEDLAAAHRAGFASAGRLRVWRKTQDI